MLELVYWDDMARAESLVVIEGNTARRFDRRTNTYTQVTVFDPQADKERREEEAAERRAAEERQAAAREAAREAAARAAQEARYDKSSDPDPMRQATVDIVGDSVTDGSDYVDVDCRVVNGKAVFTTEEAEIDDDSLRYHRRPAKAVPFPMDEEEEEEPEPEPIRTEDGRVWIADLRSGDNDYMEVLLEPRSIHNRVLFTVTGVPTLMLASLTFFAGLAVLYALALVILGVSLGTMGIGGFIIVCGVQNFSMNFPFGIMSFGLGAVIAALGAGIFLGDLLLTYKGIPAYTRRLKLAYDRINGWMR